MNNQLQTFNFQNQSIRIEFKNGEPLFCLTDVAEILLIKNANPTRFNFKDDGVHKMYSVDSKGRKNEITFINEPNLYRVIFRSNKPEAVKFQDWIFEEVIPQIRKTGAYIQPNALPEHLRGKDLGQILSQAFATDAQHRAAQPPAPPKKPAHHAVISSKRAFTPLKRTAPCLRPPFPKKALCGWTANSFTATAHFINGK